MTAPPQPPHDPRFTPGFLREAGLAYLRFRDVGAVARHLGARRKKVRAALALLAGERVPEWFPKNGMEPLCEPGYYARALPWGASLRVFAYSPYGSYVGHAASFEEASALASAHRAEWAVPDATIACAHGIESALSSLN